MPSASSRCALSFTSSRLLRAAAEHRVEDDCEEEDRALEGERPVAVPLRVDDPELDHAEHRGAEAGADHGAVAAGEEAAADDRADDEDELEPDPLLRLHRPELDRLDDPH